MTILPNCKRRTNFERFFALIFQREWRRIRKVRYSRITSGFIPSCGSNIIENEMDELTELTMEIFQSISVSKTYSNIQVTSETFHSFFSSNCNILTNEFSHIISIFEFMRIPQDTGYYEDWSWFLTADRLTVESDESKLTNSIKFVDCSSKWLNKFTTN